MAARQAKFKEGDQVQLLSGGPTMTVSHVHPPSGDDREAHYVCKWFAGANVKSEIFNEPTLQLVTGAAKK